MWGDTRAWVGRRNELGIVWDMEDVDPFLASVGLRPLVYPPFSTMGMSFFSSQLLSAQLSQGRGCLCCAAVLGYLHSSLFPPTSFLPRCALAFPKALPAVLDHGLSLLAGTLQPCPMRLGLSWDPNQGCHPAQRGTPQHQAC